MQVEGEGFLKQEELGRMPPLFFSLYSMAYLHGVREPGLAF